MAAVTLLICDDAVMYATMLSAFLRPDPEIEVVGTVDDGPQAVELARELRPDVVLLDHLLDGSDSSVIAPQVREAAPDAAIVVMSGSTAAALEAVARAVQADGWVPKAATLEDVKAAVLAAARSAR